MVRVVGLSHRGSRCVEPHAAALIGQPYNQLQIILKILRNLSNQMRPVGTRNIVVMAGIDEVVQLLAVVDAVLDEDEAVLPHHHGVSGAADHPA